MMLQHLTGEVLKECFLIEFRNLPTALFGYKHFRKNGYFPINWIRVYNSLHSLSPEERLDSKRKRQINRSLKLGATFQEAVTEEEIRTFLKLLKRHYSSKVRKHFPHLQLFRLLAQNSAIQKAARIFIVRYKNRIIGGSFCMYSNDRAYLCFSFGLRKTFAWLHPNCLAIWAALTDAHQQGYRHFEFNDAGLPYRKVGYRNFILSFGGKQVSTRRWFRFRWEWLNKLSRWLYR
jgi:predicted N-acyltransferase